MKTHKLTKAEIGRRVARNPNHPWRRDNQHAAQVRHRTTGKAVAKG